jgi:hypothetical protein
LEDLQVIMGLTLDLMVAGIAGGGGNTPFAFCQSHFINPSEFSWIEYIN